ncbi:MAG: type II and III secretion system protein family protein [Pseudomonadota bacterium]
MSISVLNTFLRLAALIPVFALSLTSVSANAAEVKNTMFIKINQGGEGPLSKSVMLSLDKAAIVELPVEARDVLVSNPEIVDAVIRSARRTYILGMQVGQTNAFFFDEEGRQILNLEIRVERDLRPLTDIYTRLLPTARIELEALNDNIVLRGSVANAPQSSQAANIAGRFIGDPTKVMNMLAIRGNEQVMLKVRIAEMQRTLIKQLGLDTNGTLTIDDLTFNWATDIPLSLQGRSFGGVDSNFDTRGFGDSIQDFDGRLRALERTGLVRTLAEPNLTAISGEGAKFLAGGEFPVPVSRDRDGNVIVEFKPFGVGLGFTPVVLDEGRISMQISTEVSELTTEGAFFSQGAQVVDPDTGQVTIIEGLQIPALTVRRAETTVELPSGGSLVMAGLLQEDLEQNIDGIPGLKDVAVLGSLFRSRDFQNDETELVIIVTPYLVEPNHISAFTDPTEGFAPASDTQTILLGRLNAAYGVKGADTGARTLQGPVGFILD